MTKIALSERRVFLLFLTYILDLTLATNDLIRLSVQRLRVPSRQSSRGGGQVHYQQQQYQTTTLSTAELQDYYDSLLPERLPAFGRQGGDGSESEPLVDIFDMYYVSVVTVGTPPRPFPVLLDTGSVVFWLRCGQGYSQQQQQQQDYTFNCRQSYTCRSTNQPFAVLYGDNTSGQGNVVDDVVCMGAICTSASQEIGCLTQDSQMPPYAYHGILGMMYGMKDSQQDVTGVMAQILGNRSCPHHVAGFWMADDARNGGEVTICGTDPNHYQGNLLYLPIVYTGDPQQWQTKLDKVQLFGKQAVSRGDGATAIFDTGTAGITGPSNVVNPILQRYGVDPNGSGVVSCRSARQFGNVVFTLGGRDFALSPDDVMVGLDNNDNRCQMTIGASDDGGNDWILGDAFIRKFYVAFDWDRAAVGVAPAKR